MSDRDRPRSAATRARAALASARAVVAAWDAMKATMPPGLTAQEGRAEVERRRLALADAVSRLRDELARVG